LAGHSYGGLLVLKFAHLFPHDTAGLVLVDPSHPDQIDRNDELRRSMRSLRTFFHLASFAANFGVMRLTNVLSKMTDGFSDSERTRGREFFASARHLISAARELDVWNETTAQTRTIQLGNLPVIILSADQPRVAWVKDFQAMHEEMTGLSTQA